MNIIRLDNSNQAKPLQTKMLKKKKFLSRVLKNFQMTTHIFKFLRIPKYTILPRI